MEIRRLRYFLATVECGTVSAAAQRVRVAQPSLSRQLRQLEREIGVELFDHEPGRVRLNAAGRQFLPLARDLVRHADRVTEAALGMASGRLERISIAAPITTLTDVVSPFVSTFAPDDPVPSVLEWTTSHDLDQLLYDVDMAIVPQAPPPHVTSVHVVTFPIWAYVRADHPWAARSAVPFEALVTEPVVVPTTQYKSRRILDSTCELSGRTFAEIVETSNGQIAQALAAAGRGTAVVTEDPAFDLTPLHIAWRDDLLRVQLHACWRPSHHASTRLREVAARFAGFCIGKYGPSVRAG